MTTREVAAAFKVSVKTVKRWEAQGKLKAIRTPGGSSRFVAADVRQAISGAMETPASD